MINYLVLFVALIIASVSGYYSVIGLTTIFAGAFWPVVVMASSIETAKVVCTSWLYRYWNNSPATIKYYLTVAVVILSLITSLGVFGFLSKAHTDLALTSGVTGVRVEMIDKQIQIEQNRLKILLDQQSRYTGPNRRFEKQIDEVQNKIIELNDKRVPLLEEQTKHEAEVGPLRYVAEMIYGKTDQSTLNTAVRSIIILIVLVFDPLAVVMIIAANHGISTRTKPESENSDEWVENIKQLKRKRKEGIVIDEQSLYKM